MSLKLFIVALLLSFNSFTYAQIPEGYYNNASNLTGEHLKSALHDIIKNHTEFPYSSSNTDTWDILKESDRDTTNTENVIQVYSGWSINGAEEYNNEQGWNREHTWAKSHGGFDTDKGTGTDLHNLKPCDISVNSARNNKDFDNGGSFYNDGDEETQCKSDSDSWEPRDEVKGDVARILFYIAVRYEGDNGELDLELLDEVNTADIKETNKGYHGKLSTLLEWHKSDPVDSFEIRRNDVIYSYQKNRNPFIDHPEYVEQIWSVPTVTEIVYQPQIKVYPNPTKDYINIELPTNETAYGTIYSMSGEKVKVFKAESRVSVQSLKSGLYILQVTGFNRVFKSKLIIQD